MSVTAFKSTSEGETGVGILDFRGARVSGV